MSAPGRPALTLVRDDAGPRPAPPREWRQANAFRTLCTLAGLTLTLPVDAAIVAGALLRRPRHSAPTGKTVLLTGGKMTKALVLARAFHRAGHRVVVVESEKYRLTGHRFSRAVDAFHCLPEPTADGYAAALRDVMRKERVDVVVPVSSPAASVPDAQALESVDGACDVLHGDAETVAALDNKYEFACLAASFGLRVPHSVLITDARQIENFCFPRGRSYVLKRIAYNPVGRTVLPLLSGSTRDRNASLGRSLSISPHDPWILQEFVAGAEYCTHSTVRNGAITVYGCSPSSACQLNYQQVDKPEIAAWVEEFARRLTLTGQVSFDFIEAVDGHPYAIECNPRTHSAITMFHDHPDVAAAYLEPHHPRITPRPHSRPTYWLYHEIWRMLAGPDRMRAVGAIARGRDAIFDWSDPLPYLAVHHLQIPALLLDNLRRRRGWSRIDFNIGKLVETGGD